jgi:hypothetical protein
MGSHHSFLPSKLHLPIHHTCTFIFYTYQIHFLSLIMANAIRTCLFFLMIILGHEILSIEGRNLDPKKKLNCVNCFSPDTKGIIATKRRKMAASPSTLNQGIETTKGVEAFRPTSPGHSPGVGHSIHN